MVKIIKEIKNISNDFCLYSFKIFGIFINLTLKHILIIYVNKYYRVLIILILINVSASESYAFISAIAKALKSAKSTNLASKTDNIFPPKSDVLKSVKPLEAESININIIEKIGLEEKNRYLRLIREGSDEAILAEHGYKQGVNTENEKLYDYIIPSWRTLRVDLKPKNSVYGCKSGSEFYNFSILPKRNQALIYSSDKKIGKATLRIEYSNAQATILSINIDNTKIYFVLLPDYGFYLSKSSDTIESIKDKISRKLITQNGYCFERNFETEEWVRYTNSINNNISDPSKIPIGRLK